MKTERIIVILFVLSALLIAGGLVWLARTPMMPPVKTVEQAIPNDHIPR